MAKVTPSMAKNQIGRSLRQVIDKPLNPVQKQQVWDYFDNQCAYCSIAIELNSRKGHLDHLLATKDGGSNDVHNFVLACNVCNGDEKREMPWREFLESKCENLSADIYVERLAHIEKWQQQATIDQLDSDFTNKMDAIVEQAKINFDRSLQQMRELRDSIIKN